MPVEKEPVDIFDSTGTNPPEEEEVLDEEEQEDEEGEDEETEDNEESDEEDDSEDDEEDDEDGDDDDEEGDDDDEDPKDREINRLKGLLKTKNNALRNMRKAKRTGAAAEQFEAPYPDSELVLAKDLPKEEQDEMTEREKKMHDDGVKMKQRFNDDAKKAFDKEQEAKADEINEDALTEDEADEFVKASAKYLAKGDTKIANQIIRKYNQFNNEGLTEEQIEDRLVDAAKLVKGFKKVKEQPTGKKGKVVKKKGSKSGLDSIVDSIDAGGAKKPIDL